MKKVTILATTLLASLALGLSAAGSAQAATTITIAPNSPVVGVNCYPFGFGSGWTPFGGFVYKNLPAFELKPGDTLAFDTSVQNDADIQFDIDLARTTANGGDVQAQPFTRVVLNSQTSAAPRGDTTAGNYELQYQAQLPFSFPGGGLIIRFSNPSPTYAADATCTENLVSGSATDTSGYFVKRIFGDADGVSPWINQSATRIGAFRLTLAGEPPPAALCEGKEVTISGSDGGETIRGTQSADVINALAGKDKVIARRGNDVVCGGKARDRIFGGAGRDGLSGEGGKDALFGGRAKDNLFGEAGRDKLFGGSGKDNLFGGRAADKLFGGRAADKLFGGSGGDKLVGGGSRNDRCFGGSGRDKLRSC